MYQKYARIYEKKFHKKFPDLQKGAVGLFDKEK